MAARTFEELWNLVYLHASDAPPELVQTWTQYAYDTLLGKRHWAWMRQEANLSVQATSALEIAFLTGSATITSLALFTSSMVGRQLRVEQGPIYTIKTFTDASTMVLTEPYGGESATETATLHDRYLPMPADFRSFYSITDLSDQRPIVWWLRRDYLDLVDPARTQSNSRFRALLGYKVAEDDLYAGRMLYEAWPAPTSAGVYRAVYFKRTDSLADSDTFKGVLATNTEVLLDGALGRCARWPGTAQKKNPYFNLKLAAEHDERFKKACDDLQVMDDDQFLDMLEQVDLAPYGLGGLAGGTGSLRASDATVGDYF